MNRGGMGGGCGGSPRAAKPHVAGRLTLVRETQRHLGLDER